MKKKSIGNAKFLVEIFSPKNSKTCETRSILDLRINSYWEPERRLCKVQISVGQSGKGGTTGYAYVFD